MEESRRVVGRSREIVSREELSEAGIQFFWLSFFFSSFLLEETDDGVN